MATKKTTDWKKVRKVDTGKTGYKKDVGFAGTIISNGTREKHLLNPNGRGAKYAQEIKWGIKLRNNDKIDQTKDGQPKFLTAEQKAYRAGYLDHARDSAKAYCAKTGKISMAKPRTFKKRGD